MAARQIILMLDEDDWNAIQSEFARRQSIHDESGTLLPDGTSNLAGAMVGEIIRDLEEYRSIYNEEHP